ncbi:hypothetical protein AVEN_159076-1 [Araneus ventricosus]|uniref:Uncharacterized protein n=1 Tax=Araneus ventricosus TaxID=182803 RepID=A0A4Y2B9P0_ARAVE|nr:hypothetical protein AVEN_159076-1 [Araneus ventricosus]
MLEVIYCFSGSLLITKFHQSVVCGFLEGVEKTGVAIAHQREKSTLATYSPIRQCGNFSPSTSQEMPKTIYFTIADALQRFFDDVEKSGIDFVVISPENPNVGGEEEMIIF